MQLADQCCIIPGPPTRPHTRAAWYAFGARHLVSYTDRTLNSNVTHIFTALAAESVAALLLHRLALNQHHTQPHTAPAPHTLVAIFLFNPWQLCAVVGGAAGGQLVSAAVLAVLVCAQQCCTTRAAMATGATMALALYVFPYSVTLLVCVSCVIVQG